MASKIDIGLRQGGRGPDSVLCSYPTIVPCAGVPACPRAPCRRSTAPPALSQRTSTREVSKDHQTGESPRKGMGAPILAEMRGRRKGRGEIGRFPCKEVHVRRKKRNYRAHRYQNTTSQMGRFVTCRITILHVLHRFVTPPSSFFEAA